MIGEVHRYLRESSQADHQRLDAGLDILEAVSTPAGRMRVVQGFYRLHAEAEAALAPWLADRPDVAFADRRRTRRLAADLATLGGHAPRTGPSDIVIRSLGEALGWLYVLEGSTLGGKAIRRALLARGDTMAGLSFLDPYGAVTGERWRDYLAVLEGQARSPDDVAAMASGARAAFRHAERHLCGAPALV